MNFTLNLISIFLIFSPALVGLEQPKDPGVYLEGYLYGLEYSSSVMLGVDPEKIMADDRIKRINEFSNGFEVGKNFYASIDERSLYSNDSKLSLDPKVEIRVSEDVVVRKSAYYAGHFTVIQIVCLGAYVDKGFDIQVPEYHLKSSGDYFKGINDAVELMKTIGLSLRD